MLRKALVVSLIFIFLWINIGYAEKQGRSWNLSKDEIEEAINQGKAEKDNISLARGWIIGPMNFKDTYIMIGTPFRNLATQAWTKWKEHQELTEEEIDVWVEFFEQYLIIFVVFYGDKIDFAKDYHCVIKLGDKIIQPLEIYNKDIAKKTDNWPSSPAYEAMNMYYFSTADIPREATIQVITIGAKEEIFTVDLSKMR